MFRPLRLIVNILFYIIEVILLLAFFLKLLNANLSNAFASWVFHSAANLIGPFKDIFPTMNLAGLRVDFTILFALVVYIIVGQLILKLLFYLDYPTRSVDDI